MNLFGNFFLYYLGLQRKDRYNVMMSTRCKVCNSAKNASQENSSVNWECENCGSLLDSKGNIATV